MRLVEQKARSVATMGSPISQMYLFKRKVTFIYRKDYRKLNGYTVARSFAALKDDSEGKWKIENGKLKMENYIRNLE